VKSWKRFPEFNSQYRRQCPYNLAVMEPAQSRPRDDLVSAGRNRCRNSPSGCVLAEPEMSPVLVVVEQIPRHQPFQMPLIQNDRERYLNPILPVRLGSGKLVA
jgi:hypothetical protein